MRHLDHMGEVERKTMSLQDLLDVAAGHLDSTAGRRTITWEEEQKKEAKHKAQQKKEKAKQKKQQAAESEQKKEVEQEQEAEQQGQAGVCVWS
jgi:hypothetical protein